MVDQTEPSGKVPLENGKRAGTFLKENEKILADDWTNHLSIMVNFNHIKFTQVEHYHQQSPISKTKSCGKAVSAVFATVSMNYTLHF